MHADETDLDDAPIVEHVTREIFLIARTPLGTDANLRVVTLAEGISLIVGRNDDVDITVDSSRVSRRHACITLRSGVVDVEDLGSRNGTRVGSKVLRCESCNAPVGSTITVGPLDLVVGRRESPALDDEDDVTEGVVLADPRMVALMATVRRLARTNATVLVQGETGSGKDIIAEQLHHLGPRAKQPFVAVDCASIPEHLLASELFGHVRGAFTGADRARPGRFVSAHGGTLFLDEIGELPIALQAKLLRVLETRRVKPVGGDDEIPFDVRVVCATHRDLRAGIEDGNFRQDLWYRISAFSIVVPPLRDRPSEIALLAQLFVRRAAESSGTPVPSIAPQAVERLVAHSWPGNVRELRNAMEHALVMSGGVVIEAEHLPFSEAPTTSIVGMRARVSNVERAAIEAALTECEGNQTHAARKLGISRRSLIYKLEKYDLRR